MSQPSPRPGRQIVAAAVIESLERLLAMSGQEELWVALSARIERRVRAGKEKYGTFLMTENGRDALQDAWEEACDLVMYLHQARLEGEPVYAQVTQAENLLCSVTHQLLLREKS